MTTKILGHRGANRRAPQNTIPAFRAAIEHGADGVEFDVQMSSDGVLVICHNFTVDATSNGTGRIDGKTFAQLRALDFGSWFSAEFAGTQIPTLEETLDCVKDMEVLNVEIKPAEKEPDLVVRKTWETVRGFGLLDKTIFSSFDFRLMRMLKEIDPNAVCGLLYDPMPEELFDKRLLRGQFLTVAEEYGADALHPHYLLTNFPRGYVRKCHEAGLMVNVWGVSRESELEKYKERNLDIIITDCI
ncbi:MAG: hypothetical protein IKX83_02475 [Clostridia bacterium]|nr:hypothetical protein [Clostridia bacterium]